MATGTRSAPAIANRPPPSELIVRRAVAPAAAAGVGVLVGATDELVAAPQTQRTYGLGRS